MSVKISACTITKNEEKNIARSIESYKDYVDEIIIVDTGSTDNTVEIAKSLGAKVIHFEWINDFSAAKNCALNAATGDWILFLDADEWIKDDGGKNIQKVIQKAIDSGLNAISLRMLNLDDDGSLTEITSSLRLFINKPNIRYVRKIHEHLMDSENSKPLVSMRVDDLMLNHCGYAESISKTKINRNKELLEKIYMNGDMDAIDYFYLARENVFENPEYAKQFLEELINDKEKMTSIKTLDIANNIQDLKLKLITLLPNKYSFNDKMTIVEDASKEFPDDPVYYYFKYVVLNADGEFNKLELLTKALELEKTYESKVGGNSNAFARYKPDVLGILGQEALIKNDNLAAMNYFVQSIQTGQMREEVLKGLLYIIASQNLNEKIAFLNSIFDINKEEQLKFIVQTLRTTQYNDVFLYYFVKYYKTFGEVDVSLFTSMMINKKAEEAAEKYLEILINESDKRAENLVVSAIITGELKEFYEKNKICFSPASRKILNAYFEDVQLDTISSAEEEWIISIIPEIIYIASPNVLEKIKYIVNYNENILRAIIRKYYLDKNNKKLIQEINTFIERDLSDEFAGEVTAKLGEACYRNEDYASAKLYLEQAIEIGYLDINLAKTYENLTEKLQIEDIEKFEMYKSLLRRFIQASNYLASEKIEDISADFISKNVDEFNKIISEPVSLAESFRKTFYDYAKKLLEMNNLYLAEEYYKYLIRCNYEVGNSYYALGKIYNKINAIELSYLCYDRAFKTSITFPATVLPDNHKNKYYLYAQNIEDMNSKCPICGKEGKLLNCYNYIEDENLTKDASLIVKYRYCDDCSHIFAENYSNKTKMIEVIKNKEEYVFNINDIKEKLDESEKLLVVDETDLISESLSEEFDVKYIKGSFEKEVELAKLLKELDEDRILITVVNNINTVLNKGLDMPLWANVDVVNAYSKQSIKKLLKDNGYTNIKIYDSKFIPGEMTIVASK